MGSLKYVKENLKHGDVFYSLLRNVIHQSSKAGLCFHLGLEQSWCLGILNGKVCREGLVDFRFSSRD